MPADTSSSSRQRNVTEVKGRIKHRLTADLVRLARNGLFPPQWLTALEIATRLEQSGYWSAHPEPLAAYLPARDCAALVNSALSELAQLEPRAWWRVGERFRAHNTDWNASAADTALRLRLARRTEERTAIFRGPEEASVIFANEDYNNDPAVRRQLVALRDSLRVTGIPELAFATSPDGAAWVMLVWTNSEQLLQSVLLSTWTSASVATA